MRASLWLHGLALLALLAGGSGCGRFAASRLAAAPNRYPRWLAPEASTQLSFPEAFVTSFPLHTIEVDSPPARLRFRVVLPADYAVGVTRSNRFEHGSGRICFRFDAQLPAPASGFTTTPRGLLFLLHGYGAEGALLMPLALRLAQEGWVCVVPDLRGHGESTGARIGFGVVETGDLAKLLDQVARMHGAERVGVIGHSYGASLALRWRGRDGRVGTAIALAAYARLAEAGENIRASHVPWFPEAVAQAGFRSLPALLEVGPGDLDPSTELQRYPAASLFVVGTKDTLTPPLDSSRLATLAGPGSRLALVPGADHEALPYLFDALLPVLLDWLETALSPQSPPAPGAGAVSGLVVD